MKITTQEYFKFKPSVSGVVVTKELFVHLKLNDILTVEMTAKEFTDLHDDLTTFYNENYDELTSEDND